MNGGKDIIDNFNKQKREMLSLVDTFWPTNREYTFLTQTDP